MHILWDTADVEIRTSSAEDSELSKVLNLKPGAGQNTTFHASLTARHSTILISAFSVYSTSFCLILFKVTCEEIFRLSLLIC